MKPVSRREYVRLYYPHIKKITEGTGIFPATQISQAIVESSGKINGVWYVGGSKLAKDYNNLHGIKAGKSWKGKSVNMKTKEVYDGKETTITDAFRVYDTPEDSMSDHVKFLIENPRYKTAGVFKAKNVTEQAEALKRAGYATDPNYAKTITSVSKEVEKYIKEIFGDNPPPAPDKQPEPTPPPITPPSPILAKTPPVMTWFLLLAAVFVLYKTMKQ